MLLRKTIRSPSLLTNKFILLLVIFWTTNAFSVGWFTDTDKQFMDAIRVGDKLIVKDQGAVFDIRILTENANINEETFEVVKIGENFIVIMDQAKTKSIRIPSAAIKSIEMPAIEKEHLSWWK